MNKNAKTSPAVWIIAIALIAIVVFFVMGNKETQLPGSQGQQQQTETGGVSIVTTNPTISFSGADAQQGGTLVSSAFYANVNNGGFGSSGSPTTAVPGQTISFLLSNSTTYHNTKVENVKVDAGTFPVKALFNKNGSVTENVYTTTGLVISNGGGTQNQTDLGNGASYNLKDEMTATALTSTQDMVCIIELTAGTNASSNPAGATLSRNGVAIPLKSTSKPIWYSTAGTDSNVYVFDVAPLDTSATQTFTIGVNAKSTGRFSALNRVIKSCYTKEYFIDPNTGVIAYDVADSNGAKKSMALYKYDIYFV